MMSTTHAHRRRLRHLVVAVSAAVLTLTGVAAVLSPRVSAAPIDNKKQQAAALEAEINANGERLGVLYEQIKYTQDKLDRANQAIAETQARIAVARTETARVRRLVRRRAASVYRSAATGTGQRAFDGDVRATAAREKYAAAASQRDRALMDQLAAAIADLRVQQADANTARQAAESQKAALATIKSNFDAGQAQRQRLLAQVRGDIKALVDQAARRRAVAQAPRPRGGRTFDPGQLPPVSGKAGIALSYAKAQLGKPYLYAATGPESFDCSGLTLAAWRTAGIALPHNSEAQYNAFPRVPMNQLQPGDLVWYPGHIAIYAGNNAVVSAGSGSGKVVYQTVSYYRGAVRPG